MSKYSSDSDSSERSSSRHQRKYKRKSTSSSYDSDESSYSSKKKSHKRKRSKGHRSRSRDKYSKSRSRYFRDDVSKSSIGSHTSRSTSAKVSRGRSRSSSREKFHDRQKRRSGKSGRSPSRGSKYRSTSSSSNDESGSKSNSSMSVDVRALKSNLSKQEQNSEEQLKAQLQQAIKAAQSADDLLRQQGFLTGISSRKDELKDPPVNVLDEINNPSFVPKSFVSQSMTTFNPGNVSVTALKTSNIQSQLTPQEVKTGSSGIFHPSLMADADQKLDKWVKKLFNLRQKAINGEPIV